KAVPAVLLAGAGRLKGGGTPEATTVTAALPGVVGGGGWGGGVPFVFTGFLGAALFSGVVPGPAPGGGVIGAPRPAAWRRGWGARVWAEGTWAMRVMLKAVPAVALAGALTSKVLAAAGLTVIPL